MSAWPHFSFAHLVPRFTRPLVLGTGYSAGKKTSLLAGTLRVFAADELVKHDTNTTALTRVYIASFEGTDFDAQLP
jgi:hypothetical protein